MSEPLTEPPLWDSTRAALRFALNNSLSLPRPPVNKLMSGGQVRRIELADGTRIVVAASRPRPRDQQLKGLDGAATAGLVLAQLSRLAEPEQLALIARMTAARLPCACRAPCCSGSRENPRYSRAVHRLCEMLRDAAALSKIPGKKGMSTVPALRKALVDGFFSDSGERELSLAKYAKLCEVAEDTVAAHKRMVHGWLRRQEDAAWETFALMLDQQGTVGLIE